MLWQGCVNINPHINTKDKTCSPLEHFLSRRIINDIKGEQRKQKAVAIALCLKHSIGRDSCIHDYNPNKIHSFIGISPNTFKTYLPLMVEMGLVHFDGKNKEHLVISSLHSKRRNRNIDIHRFSFKTFKAVYDSLRAFIMLLIQKRKDFVKRTLQLANNPHPGDDCKKARIKVRCLVRQGILRKTIWDEKGISYRKIANEIGCCIRTAQDVVKYAIKQRWCRKTTHFDYYYMKGVNHREVNGYTFTTRNYGFLISANTYSISNGIKKCLS